jgi:hypothetical protein
MTQLIPISVTIARIQAMKKGPCFPILTNKAKKKPSLTEKEKEVLQERLNNLISKASIPVTYNDLDSALTAMRKEVKEKYSDMDAGDLNF